ncbi:MAG: hypothetical protein ACK4V6_12155, partial [Microthrixaceae bacterium]
TESSGLARSNYKRKVLFTHNDSGDSARIFAVGNNGSTRAVLTIKGANAYDWEDISTGPDRTLWIGDIGDNGRSRQKVDVYRITEPKRLRTRSVRSTRYSFAYPDRARDAEGLMVHPRTGRLFIITKSESGAGIYRAPRKLSKSKLNRLKRVGSAPAKVTAASFSRNGKRFALGTYTSSHIYTSIGSTARVVPMPSRRQGESLEITRSGKSLLAGSEGSNSPVYRIDLTGDRHPASGSTSGVPGPAPDLGDVATPSCPKAPAYSGSPTKFGTSLSTSKQTLSEALDKVDSAFGRVPVVRTFDPSIPPQGAWSRRAPVLGSDRMIVTSFRVPPADVLAGKYDAQIRDYFSTAPSNTILYSYFHEADAEIAKYGTFTTAQFRAAFRRVVDIASSLCRGNLYPTLILTGWTASSSSGRHWTDFYPGTDYVSVMSWDPYNSATRTPTEYVDPSKLYANVLQASKEIGKPWGIAETGSARLDDDQAGTGRAAWLHKVGEYFSSQGAEYVTYFQSTRDADFELRDTPSIDAWKAWVTR